MALARHVLQEPHCKIFKFSVAGSAIESKLILSTARDSVTVSLVARVRRERIGVRAFNAATRFTTSAMGGADEPSGVVV